MENGEILVTVNVLKVADGADAFYIVEVYAPKHLPFSVVSEIQPLYKWRLLVSNLSEAVKIAHPFRFKELSEAKRLAIQLGTNIKECLSDISRVEVKTNTPTL